MDTSHFNPVLRASQALPLSLGLIGWICVDYSSQTFALVPESDRAASLMIFYVAGAHFLTSFALILPALALSQGKSRSPLGTAIYLIAVLNFLFWAMVVQQTTLAEAITAGAWVIPIPAVRWVVENGQLLAGIAFDYLFPLASSWTLLMLYATINIPSAFQRKPAVRRRSAPAT